MEHGVSQRGHGQLLHNLRFWRHKSCTAYADRGKFGLSPAFGYGGIQGFSGNQPLNKPTIDQFAIEIDDFSHVLQTDGSSKVSGEEGLRDLVVIEAI